MILKNSKPFLTIIIPTYNSEATLAVSLESIVNQTFKDIEVLIMDGLSVDNTLKIAKTYQVLFSNIHIISDKDKGIYDAMNKGIDKAKGEWLYFMGSDDALFDSDVLQKVYEEIENFKIHVLYGSVNSIFYGGKYDGEFTYEKLTKNNICHQAIFFHKSVFNKIGKFNLKYKVAADWDHNIKWFFNNQIKKHYIDLIIAEFSDGGYSYLHEDILFEQHRNLKLIRKGFLKFPIRTLKKLCKTEKSKLSKKDRIIKKVEVLSWFYMMKIRLKIEYLITSNNLV